jgi:hypothetical protein
VQWIWKRQDSVVNELLQCLAPHLSEEALSDFKHRILKHGPHDSGSDLTQCLLWYVDNFGLGSIVLATITFFF